MGISLLGVVTHVGRSGGDRRMYWRIDEEIEGHGEMEKGEVLRLIFMMIHDT
jgi:hypothetical protein